MKMIATFLPLHRDTDTYAFVKIFLSSVCKLLYCKAYKSNEEYNDEFSFQSRVKDFVKILKDI